MLFAPSGSLGARAAGLRRDDSAQLRSSATCSLNLRTCLANRSRSLASSSVSGCADSLAPRVAGASTESTVSGESNATPCAIVMLTEDSLGLPCIIVWGTEVKDSMCWSVGRSVGCWSMKGLIMDAALLRAGLLLQATQQGLLRLRRRLIARIIVRDMMASPPQTRPMMSAVRECESVLLLELLVIVTRTSLVEAMGTGFDEGYGDVSVGAILGAGPGEVLVKAELGRGTVDRSQDFLYSRVLSPVEEKQGCLRFLHRRQHQKMLCVCKYL